MMMMMMMMMMMILMNFGINTAKATTAVQSDAYRLHCITQSKRTNDCHGLDLPILSYIVARFMDPALFKSHKQDI